MKYIGWALFAFVAIDLALLMAGGSDGWPRFVLEKHLLRDFVLLVGAFALSYHNELHARISS